MALLSRRKPYRVRCPDGGEKLVERNIDDAFPLELKNLKAGINLDLAAIEDGTLKAKVGADYGELLSGVLFRLGDLTESLMISYRGLYAGYKTDPCANGAALMRQVERIVEETQRHAAIQVRVKGLIELAERDSIEREEIPKVFREVILEIGGPGVGSAAANEVEQAQKDAQRWVGQECDDELPGGV